jgi:methanogenic corrinoid protein MtbC1
MATEERTVQIIDDLFNAVVNMDEDASRALSQTALDEGIDAYRALMEGLAAAMDKVGKLYSEHEYFVPELLLCSDALYAGMEILKPHIKVNNVAEQRKILLGTVEGDIHDIGKNLVKVMFEAAGWEVYDLGADVKIGRFVEEQRKVKADVIGLSALMTTSMLAIPKIIEEIRKEYTQTAVLVGGAPLTRHIAVSYGADGYADNAGEAVAEALRIIGLKR